MLFRQAGVFHTHYAADRGLFPIPADRFMIGALLVFFIIKMPKGILGTWLERRT